MLVCEGLFQRVKLRVCCVEFSAFLLKVGHALFAAAERFFGVRSLVQPFGELLVLIGDCHQLRRLLFQVGVLPLKFRDVLLLRFGLLLGGFQRAGELRVFLLEGLHGLLGLFKLRLCAGVLRGALVGFAERFGELGVFAFKLGVLPAELREGGAVLCEQLVFGGEQLVFLESLRALLRGADQRGVLLGVGIPLGVCGVEIPQEIQHGENACVVL